MLTRRTLFQTLAAAVAAPFLPRPAVESVAPAFRAKAGTISVPVGFTPKSVTFFGMSDGKIGYTAFGGNGVQASTGTFEAPTLATFDPNGFTVDVSAFEEDGPRFMIY